jgi:hypothetical protein
MEASGELLNTSWRMEASVELLNMHKKAIP